jgi:hypothetical protein
MSACIECGLPEGAWPHRVNHPAVTTKPEAHLFVREVPKLVLPTPRTRINQPKHRKFVRDDIALVTLPGRTIPLRVKVQGRYPALSSGRDYYSVTNNEDPWDTDLFYVYPEDLTLVRWDLRTREDQ